MSLYRMKCILLPLGLAAIAAFAALSAFAKPASFEYSTRGFSSLAEAVASDFDANEARADSAPQQQVVAGWATKDFLNVLVVQADETNARIAEARESASRDAERTWRILGLGVMALCWIGIWMPVARPEQEPGQPVQPQGATGDVPLPPPA